MQIIIKTKFRRTVAVTLDPAIFFLINHLLTVVSISTSVCRLSILVGGPKVGGRSGSGLRWGLLPWARYSAREDPWGEATFKETV